LKKGIDVDFYCYAVPYETKKYNVFGEIKTYECSPYEEYEKALNLKLKEKLGRNLIGEGKLLVPIKK
jgi:hypothetical protein